MNLVLEFGKKINFTVFNFLSGPVQITTYAGDENHLVFFPIMLGAAIKGILLGAAQLQAGNDVGDLDALSHSIQRVRLERQKAPLGPDRP